MGRYSEGARKGRGESRLPVPEIPDIDRALDAVGSNSGNLFNAAVGDLGEMAKGLGTLGFLLTKDVLGETAELGSKLPLVPNYEHSSQIDDLAKALPSVVAGDYAKRYGSREGFTEGLKEDPLAFVGDVLTVLTLGGYSAARGAQVASKSASVTDDLARLAAGEVDDIGRVAKVVDKVLPGAKLQAAGDELAPLGGIKQTLSSTGDKVVPVERAFNPTRRLFREAWDDALSRPIKSLQGEHDALLKKLEDGDISTPEEIDLMRKSESLRLAKDNNITRQTRPWVSEKRIGRSVQKIIGESKSQHVAARDLAMGRWKEVLSQLPEDKVDDFHLTMQMATPDAMAPRLTFDKVEQALTDPAVLETPIGQHLKEVVTPHIERLKQMALDPEIDPLEIQAGQRIIEAVAGEPLASLGNDLDAVSKTMDDARLLNFEHEASQFLDEGGSYLTLFNRQYLPMKIAEMKQLGLKSLDETTDAFKLDDAIQGVNKKTPVYYPHYDTLGKNRSAFLMSMNTHAARRAAKVTAHKKSSGQLFRKWLDGTKDAYDTNPADAYSRLAAEVVKHQEMERWIQEIADEFGYPISAKDELASGYVAMNLDGVRMFLRKRRTGTEAMHDALEAGMEPDEAFVKAMEAMFSDPVKDVGELAAKRGAIVAIPEVVAKKIQSQGKYFLGGAKVRLFWDGPVNVWRNLTLYAMPRYYINNAFGNTAFLKLQGGKLTGALRQLDKRYRDEIRRVLPDEILPRVEQGFHSSTLQRSTHMGAAEGTVTGQMVKGLKESKVGRGVGTARDTAQGFNSFVENLYRRESFLTAVEKQAKVRGLKLTGNSWLRSKKRLEEIAKLGADKKIFKQAADELDRVMNNYQALSPFEQHVMRRFVAPFWPFYKHAAKTLIKLPFEHPAKARVLEWINLVSEDMDTLGDRPEWLEDYGHLGPGDVPGEERFASTRGANPLSGVLESPFSLANPAIQMGYEQVTGKDAFTQKPFTSPGVYTDFFTGDSYSMGDQGPERMDRRLGGLLSPNAPGLLETLTGLVPFADAAGDVLGGGARYSSGETIMEDGAPKYPVSPMAELAKLFGVSTIDYDLGSYQSKQREAEDRAATALRRTLGP